VRRVNVADTREVLAAARGPDWCGIESPTNPTIEVADLPALGRSLSRRNAFVVDNTFATPLLATPARVRR
jgi:cystathionine gamma-synthase